MIFFKNIIQTTLFKIFSLNSLSVLLKIAVGLVTSKLLAVFVGPSGMALVGNLRNFMTSIESISTLGFQNGIVKYVAEADKDKLQISKIFATVFYSLVLVALVLSGVLFFFATSWSDRIFTASHDYSLVFKVLALTLPWHAISIFMVSILNGLGLFKRVIWITIIGNGIGLLVSIFLIVFFETMGALMAIVIAPALLFFVSFYLINNEISFWKTIRLQYFDFGILKNLSSYSVMALVSSVLGPLVFLAIRNNMILTLGLDQTGYWETMSRISSYYMLFVSTILAVYFLPKLAKAQSYAETKTIFWSYYKTMIPIFCFGFFVLYSLRFFVVELLFSKAFLPVTTLFFWQLMGDFVKVGFLILGVQFFAKKLTLAFVISEISSLAFLYFLSIYLIRIYGITGALMAQFLDHLVYLIALLIYFRKRLF